MVMLKHAAFVAAIIAVVMLINNMAGQPLNKLSAAA
jgi:hypothetical protein